MLLKQYKENPPHFTIQYQRTAPPEASVLKLNKRSSKNYPSKRKSFGTKKFPWRLITTAISETVCKDLSSESLLEHNHPSGKKHGFYLKKPKRSIHDREVLTRYAGELIQHDSSHHLWAPAAKEKWYLITSLDDYSRFLLYAVLVRKETSWTHILAPYKPSSYDMAFLTPTMSIPTRSSDLSGEGIPSGINTTSWPMRQPLSGNRSCRIARSRSPLSFPQARGKIERPYGWLQDHLIRTCVREDVSEIKHAQRFLTRNSIDITTARFTLPPRRSLISDSKKL